MKKKLFSTLLAICLMVPFAFMLAGCAGGSDLVGKTYVYESARIEWSASATQEQKDALATMFQVSVDEVLTTLEATMLGSMTEEMEGTSMTFKADGVLEMVNGDETMNATYTQSGSNVSVTSEGMTQQCTIVNGKLVMSMDMTELAEMPIVMSITYAEQVAAE